MPWDTAKMQVLVGEDGRGGSRAAQNDGRIPNVLKGKEEEEEVDLGERKKKEKKKKRKS